MPQPVAALAQRLWREALNAAAGHAAEDVELERQALLAERSADERPGLSKRLMLKPILQ